MAKKPGPRSSAEMSVVQLADHRKTPRLQPPSTLTAIEASYFRALVTANPHLQPGDQLFLAAYCATINKVNRLAKKLDKESIRSWELASRVMISMSVKLRLVPHSVTHPERAGRGRSNAAPMTVMEMFLAENE